MEVSLCALEYTVSFVISLTIAHQFSSLESAPPSPAQQGAQTVWPSSLLSRHPSHALCIDQRFGGWIPRRHHPEGPESTLATDVEAVRSAR